MNSTTSGTAPKAAKTRIALHWRILIALVLGTLVGIAINQFWTASTWASLGVNDAGAFLAGRTPTPDPNANPNATAIPNPNANANAVAYIARFAGKATKFIGDLFLQSLRFVAVPIVLFSLIAGVASLGDPRKLGRIGGRTLLLFLITAVVSCVIGLALSIAVKPGTFVSVEVRMQVLSAFGNDAAKRIASAEAAAASLSVWDQVVRVVSSNPFDALARGDLLQVVVAAVFIGLGLTMIPKQTAQPVLNVLHGLAEAFLQLIRLIMKAAPYAVFALIVPIVANLGLTVLGALAVYGLVVVAALAMILFVLYPLVLRATLPKGQHISFRRLFRAMAPAQFLAFSSSSSAATLPVTIECVRDRLGVPEDITSFVCPLGATINMDGTAAYQCIAVTFLAQVFGVALGPIEYATIAGLAVLVSIGSPGLPGASIVLMVVVMDAVKVPTQGIAIILALDRVLDMCRTVVNVSGDAIAAAAVAGMEGRDIPDLMLTPNQPKLDVP